MAANGGRRAGAGRKKGGKNAATIAKDLAKEIVRQQITKELQPLIRAAIRRGLGLSYLVTRDAKTGKFIRITRQTLRSVETVIEVWEKEPDMIAIRELLDRAIDRAPEPPQHVAVDGELMIRWEE